MINLLPPELKSSYRYARRNVLLVRWVVVLAISLLGLFAISTGGLIYLRQINDSYAPQIAATQASLEQQKLSQTRIQVTDMTSSLKLATQVLSKEVLFSKLLTQLATVMPSNAILTDLTISQTQGALDISALATNYDAATQVQVNLADPNNKIFSSADIVNISCSSAPSTDSTTSRYPCKVTIRALLATNNPFLFINDSGKSS